MNASAVPDGLRIPALDPLQREHDATVLICTYNRADYLGETLDSLAGCAASGFSWDVLVVDNNSSDDTRAVVESRVARFPVRLRYLFEARQGKSNALNTGMTAANSIVIVFTDDDVKVADGWLNAAVRPLLERSDLDYTGGPVRPIWTAPRPRWLDERGNLGGPIAIKDHGPEPFCFEDQRHTPLGVNMAVRRGLIERVGGFRPDLGRNGKSLLGQEQAEFFYRTRAAGARGLYVPEMVLDHVVVASRLTRSYYRRWFYWKGVSHARVHQLHGRTELGIDLHHARHIFGIPAFIFGNAVRHARGWLSALFGRDERRRARHWFGLAYCVGYGGDVVRRKVQSGIGGQGSRAGAPNLPSPVADP